MFVGSNLISHTKIESFHLYSPSSETLECSALHYYDSETNLQVINYAFPERSTPEYSNSWKFSKHSPHLIIELSNVHSMYGSSCSISV